jgi:hypothetical protein
MRCILAVRWRFNVLTALVIPATLLFPLCKGEAKVFHSKQEALALAFPDADKVDTRTFFLTEEQAQRIATLAMTPIESKLVTAYVGQKSGEVLGYAFIEHTDPLYAGLL